MHRPSITQKDVFLVWQERFNFLSEREMFAFLALILKVWNTLNSKLVGFL